MERYQNGWPIKPYLTIYLRHVKGYYEGMTHEYTRHRCPTMKIEVLVPRGHPVRTKRRKAKANDHAKVVSPQRCSPPPLHVPVSWFIFQFEVCHINGSSYIKGNTPPLCRPTNGSQEDVLQFLRNLIPSQETLIPAFLNAGVENQGYLRSLAYSCSLRKAFLEKLQMDKQITFIQTNILDEGLQRLRYWWGWEKRTRA